jgi:hypothetical protein
LNHKSFFLSLTKCSPLWRRHFFEQFQFPHNFPGKTATGTTTAEAFGSEVTLPGRIPSKT